MPRKPGTTPDPRTPEDDLAPFYAVAGLADVIAETLRETLAARQRKAEERLAEIRDRRLERVEQARVNADELREFLSTLPEQFRALPETTRTRLAEVQRQTEELLAQAGDTYSALAGRGKRVVDERVGDVRAAGSKVRRSAEETADDVAEAVQPLVDQADEAVTEVRRNVTGRAARTRKQAAPADAPTEVTPESATQAARAAAAKAPARKTPVKKTTATKVTSADTGTGAAQALAQDREAAAKKTAAKKTAAKKTTAKKAPAKKAAPAAPPAAPATDGSVAEDTSTDAVTGPGTGS